MRALTERALAVKLEAQGLAGVDVDDLDRRRDRGGRVASVPTSAPTPPRTAR